MATGEDDDAAPIDARLTSAAKTKLLVVAGPTASGKSALALALAERLGGMVINADSMQVYRDLPILTAQPDAQAMARAPHRLYGVLDLAERCSAGRWRELALEAIAAAQDSGLVPIVVGGTGLYLRALLGGLADIPPIPDAIRAAERERMALLGPAAFHAELATRDPAMAARLQPSDRQRLVRAAEVLQATGRSLAEWQRATAEDPAACRFDLRSVRLDPPRQALYASCDARVHVLVATGAVDEARRVAARLAEARLADDLPALKALGLRELMAYAAGQSSLEAAISAVQAATRHYAKRQVTWFNGQFVAGMTIDKKLSERTVAESVSNIIKFFLTPGN